MKNIELWSGPFGSGKSTKIIEKYKGSYCNECIFIVMDGFESIFREFHNIETISFSEASNCSSMTLNRKIFIDDADVFIEMYGFFPLLNILNNYNQIHLTAMNSAFAKATTYEKSYPASVFMENLEGVKIHKLRMKDNPGLPEDYIEEIQKHFGYKE